MRSTWLVVVLAVSVPAGCATTEPPAGPVAAGPSSATTEPAGVGRATVDDGTGDGVGDGRGGRSGGEVVEVVEVVDGDTLRVSGPTDEVRVRVVGINTPERDECYYDEATTALGALVAGAEVRLVRDVSDTDQYGRLLRYVETMDGVDVGAELVRGGFARSRRYEPDTARNARYDELQAEAQAAGRGLWASDACGAPAGSDDVRLTVEVRADAPGNDAANPNGEWVRFTNDGPVRVDLSGWEVADESSSHRYRFDTLTLAPGASVTLFSGCGTDGATERYWCDDAGPVWNNDGDTVFLLDPAGNTVVAETYRD